MNFCYKYLIASFLLLVFGTKLLLPLVTTYKQLVKYTTAEQKEEKSSEEKEADDDAQQKGKIEVAYLATSSFILFSLFISKSFFSGVPAAFLQVQYFAVPTPPPWC